jgi:hypothetical protein
MNIFESLGLHSEHRIKDKVTMKVKHWAEVPESKKLKEGSYYGQVKKDGIFCHVVKYNHEYYLFSRTGMLLSNTSHLVHQLMIWGRDLKEGVYMTELCCDSCSLEALSGIFNPNRVKPLDKDQDQWRLSSYLAFHDYISIEEFVSGRSERTYGDRYLFIKAILPMELYLISSYLVDVDSVDEFAEYYINHDEEGVVLKRIDEVWVASHKGHRMMKIVRGIDYDLECIGVEEGTGKYKGKAANLIFRWKGGKKIKAMPGKGWTHEDAEIAWYDYHHNNLCNPIGNIYKVHALQESSKGKLRLPKVRERRFDKEEADF